MKNAKKLFSFALAVVMLLSTLSVAGFALSAERNDYANVKYSVSKTDVIEYNGEKIDLSATDLAGDIYALTISVKAAYGINYLQIPYYFNLDKFGVLCEYYSLDEIYWNTDNYYADWGVDANPGYTMGPAWSDAGAYNAAGAAATGRNIMCYGLANTNAANQYTITSKVFDPSTPGYDLWCEGISKDFTVGGGFFTIQCTFTKAKASYINVVDGKVVTDDYVDIYTCYLYNHSGDPIGEEIGAYTDWEKDSVNNIQVAWDDSYSTGTTPRNSYIAGSSKTETTSWASFVENAVVEEAKDPSPVVNYSSQIRYTGPVDGEYAPFDIRSRAGMSTADFAAICGDDAAAEENIEAVGFVYTVGEVEFKAADAKAAIEAKETTGAYVYKECTEIAKDTVNNRYYWSCVITDDPETTDKYEGPDYEGSMNAYAFITVGGVTYFVDDAQPTDFSDLYDAYDENIPNA